MESGLGPTLAAPGDQFSWHEELRGSHADVTWQSQPGLSPPGGTRGCRRAGVAQVRVGVREGLVASRGACVGCRGWVMSCCLCLEPPAAVHDGSRVTAH